MPDATYIPASLPQLQNHRQYFTILSRIQALDTKRPVASLAKGDLLGICHPASVVFFQLHGGMVNLMQVLATPSSTVA